MDIVNVLRRMAQRNPDRPLAADSKVTVTYAEADSRSDAIASEISAAGIGPGETIGLCAPDSVDLLLTIIATWKVGGLPSLIDPRTQETELPYFVEDVGSKLVVCAPGLADRLSAAGAAGVADLGQLASAAAPQRAYRSCHGPGSPLYLSYTSGTTGVPKGAILNSGPVTLGTACIAERLGLTRQDVLLATTPTSSSFQLVAALMPAIHVGASVVLVAGSRAEQFTEVAAERGATVLVAYPLTLSDVVHLEDRNGCSFRLALSGGSPLAPRIKREYKARFGIPLVESYGQSELGGFMALGQLAVDERALSGFVGRPLPDRPAVICGPDGVEVPAGQWGEVAIADGYFAGYKNKPEATQEALRGGVLHTGDLGIADDDGFIKVLGRTREQADALRRGGFLRDVEDAYYEHPAVKHAAVVSGAQGRVEAFVELLAPGQANADEIAAFAGGRVAPALRPAKTTALLAMPRSFSGKADRRRLEQQVVV